MKYFTLILLAVIMAPVTAKAELTEAKVTQFNENYAAAFGSCNEQKVDTFIQEHYAENYTMLLKAPNGQMRQANKEQIKMIALQGIQMMVEINGPEGNCRPDMITDKVELKGDRGMMQTTQKEELTVPKNGKMVGVRANTTCQHQITDNNDTLTIQKSECVMYQPQQQQ